LEINPWGVNFVEKEKDLCSYDLTLAQQFELTVWKNSVQNMPLETLQQAVIELAELLFRQQNAAKCFVMAQIQGGLK
jgi:Phycobilisome degradation protein nblA